jgi:hypothetical protein
VPFKKIVKFWDVNEVRCDPKQMDVTNFRCEEDNDSLQVLDSTGAVVADFGPGKEYEGWMLTVEYSSVREQLSSLSLSILKGTQSVYTPANPLAAVGNASPVPRPAAETGFILVSTSVGDDRVRVYSVDA